MNYIGILEEKMETIIILVLFLGNMGIMEKKMGTSVLRSIMLPTLVTSQYLSQKILRTLQACMFCDKIQLIMYFAKW